MPRVMADVVVVNGDHDDVGMPPGENDVVLNDGSSSSVASTAILTTASGPRYLQGVTFVPPRRAQLVVRFSFDALRPLALRVPAGHLDR